MNSILVHSLKLNPRVIYVFQFIAERWKNVAFNFTSNLNEYKYYNGLSLNYSDCKIKESELFLFQSSAIIQDIKAIKNYSLSGLDESLKLEWGEGKFDLICSIFFMLSRAEEYETEGRDIHDRFVYNQTRLSKYLDSRIPIVDIWINEFKNRIEQHFRFEILSSRSFNFTLGVDIDFFWKYKNKSIFKGIGGFLKDLKRLDFIAVANRFLVISGLKNDPYLSYDTIQNIGFSKESIMFFILSGGQTKFDNNQKLNHKSVAPLLEEIRKVGEIALHPSYDACSDCSFLNNELHTLETISKMNINKSRFHFIRLNFPQSYLCLLQNKITQDYSMGYPDILGFRAGTCHSFLWYNLQTECVTDLRLHPFAAMDRTMLSYLKYDYNEAMAELIKLSDTIKAHSGEFHLIWHNSSFDEKSEFLVYKTLLSNFCANYLTNANS